MKHQESSAQLCPLSSSRTSESRCRSISTVNSLVALRPSPGQSSQNGHDKHYQEMTVLTGLTNQGKPLLLTKDVPCQNGTSRQVSFLQNQVDICCGYWKDGEHSGPRGRCQSRRPYVSCALETACLLPENGS